MVAPMTLNGVQVRQLRSMCNGLSPSVIVGKNGVDEGVVARAGEALEAHELVKCSVLGACGLDAKEAAYELASRCGAEVVQVVGRKFSIYRATHRKDVRHIELA